MPLVMPKSTTTPGYACTGVTTGPRTGDNRLLPSIADAVVAPQASSGPPRLRFDDDGVDASGGVLRIAVFIRRRGRFKCLWWVVSEAIMDDGLNNSEPDDGDDGD